MRNANPLVKLFGASALLTAMVIMTGCAGDRRDTLTLGAGVSVDTSSGADKKSDNGKTDSCCSKTGTKPANVQNECATPNSAGSCCAKKAATKCDCPDCKCCKACKTDGKCECVDCKCCASCKVKVAAAAAPCCAKKAATKCDCPDCKCCKACKTDGKCECVDCKCCASCKVKDAAAKASATATGNPNAPAGAAVKQCDCTDCNCCKACKTNGKCECVDCKCCASCKEKAGADLLLPTAGPSKK
ncbi:MAG: hypothetical protein SGJ27_06715 [Candidatus Melainabacteria bacterium]|nr:hypothetical protein [Candidatus Melainabacteria bacterium]